MERRTLAVSGRWIEGAGIGVLSGAVVSTALIGLSFTFLYLFLIGLAVLVIGALVVEDNK